MEGFKITVINESHKNLNFEDDKNTQISFNKIRSEFLKKLIKWFKYVLVVVIVIIIHFSFIYPVYLIPDNGAGITSLQPYSYNFTINWTLFSTGLFVIVYCIKLMVRRITPSLKNYLSSELKNIGFKIHQKRNSWIVFMILNIISILLILLLELRVINFRTNIFNTLFRGSLIIYLILSLIIPIIWQFTYDKISVKIKNDYQIKIIPNYKIHRNKTKYYQLIGIYFISNKIAFKFNKKKVKLYNKIKESRWLPKKNKSLLSKFGVSFFLRFNEFSTPNNFQKQFLNIVLALKEWDAKIS